MYSVYENCPEFENKRFKLRLVSVCDCDDLLKVYSDKKAVPLFNSDNCNGDKFYYTTREKMQAAIEYWRFEYNRKGFVRWSIIDKDYNIAVGTIELFHRDAKDFFTDCGLLRLDLRSDYETKDYIKSILNLIEEKAYTLFECSMVATKAWTYACERIEALKELKFTKAKNMFIAPDGKKYSSYYFKKI